jgi:hypothetical protein
MRLHGHNLPVIRHYGIQREMFLRLGLMDFKGNVPSSRHKGISRGMCLCLGIDAFEGNCALDPDDGERPSWVVANTARTGTLVEMAVV